jgi:microcystin-dependent protein
MITYTKPILMRQLAMALFAAISVAQVALAATTPPLIPFQARLTDNVGIVLDGQQNLIFKLYDVAVEGSAVWTEQHDEVGVIDGMVNVFLGSINSFQDSNGALLISFSEAKYLGITVAGEDEMLPRQILLPAFHARNADTLNGSNWNELLVADGNNDNNPETGFIRGSKIENDGITSEKIAAGSIEVVDLKDDSVSGGVGGVIEDGSITTADLSVTFSYGIAPVGSILPYAGEAEPDGWMFCDGRLLDPENYGELHAVIGFTWGADAQQDYFNIPDLRGRVPAGKTSTEVADRLDPTLEDPDSIDGAPLLFDVAGNPADSSTLGAVGGEDMHLTTELEMPSHRHSHLGGIRRVDSNDQNNSTNGGHPGGGSDPVGGGAAHNNVQPTAIVHYIIRVGA